MAWYDNLYLPPQVATMPFPLYQSLQGRYFVGYADDMVFGQGTSAWAGLMNPINSGVNLFVNVWTATDVGTNPIRAQIWFNSQPPGESFLSPLVTPANTTIYPTPMSRVELRQANNVTGSPVGGIKAFVRRVAPETTEVGEEDGKFIMPPGGSFVVFLSNPESPTEPAAGRVAFGWWVEPIRHY